MSIEIIEDVIVRRGDGIYHSGSKSDSNGSVPYSTYSFIRFAGGRVLNKVTIRDGLDGEIGRVIDEGKRCKFHRMGQWLVAVEEPDGTVFASNLNDHVMSLRGAVIGQIVIGTPLLLAFGAGLLVYLYAWHTYTQLQAVKQARDHIKNIPDAIVI